MIETLPDEWQLLPELEGSGVKLFTFRAPVTKMDGLFKNVTIKASSIVPVEAAGRVIGCISNLYREDDLLIANVVIDYSTPERLEIETQESPLWADGDFVILEGNYDKEGNIQPGVVELKRIELNKNRRGHPAVLV